MSKKVILGDNSEKIQNQKSQQQKKENYVSPNLFLGRIESENTNAKFPDWDIVPPNQFINPRLKIQ